MKTFFTVLALSLLLPAFAQEFSGKATYQTKMIVKDFDSEIENNPKLSRDIKDAMRRATEKTFILEFTQNESFYTEEEKLETPTTGGRPKHNIVIRSKDSGKLYKNLKENFSILENDMLGKIFLIKDTLHASGWKLSTESKQIGNYTAYKATKIIKPKKSEEKKEEDINFLSMVDQKEPKELVYTAWYTPQIPIPNGPGKFGGLPGLILELHDEEMVYLCSEIVLNPKKLIIIKVPKGATISPEEFDTIREERNKEFQRRAKTYPVSTVK